MNAKEYKQLIELDFVSKYGDGDISFHWDHTKAPYYGKTLPFVHDIDRPLDPKNLIILFPCHIGNTGSLITDYRLPIDHPSYYHDIKEWLGKEAGVHYKNNIAMTCPTYDQVSFGMLIIEDGIAYACDTANPLKALKVWKNLFKDVKYDSRHDDLDFYNKQIVFSGIIVHRIRNKTI